MPRWIGSTSPAPALVDVEVSALRATAVLGRGARAPARPDHRRSHRHPRSRRRRAGRSGAARHPHRLSLARRRDASRTCWSRTARSARSTCRRRRLSRVAFTDSARRRGRHARPALRAPRPARARGRLVPRPRRAARRDPVAAAGRGARALARGRARHPPRATDAARHEAVGRAAAPPLLRSRHRRCRADDRAGGADPQ